MAGLGNITTESRSEKLWIPQDTISQNDVKVYEDKFPRSGSVAFFIAEGKNGASALSKDALTDLMELHTTVGQ